MAPIKQQASSALIRSINPRLISYTRPLLLALLILAGTLGVTAAIFVIQVVMCPTEMTVTDEVIFGNMNEQSDTFRKRHSRAGTQGGTTTTVKLCLKAARELVTVGHPNFADSLTAPGVVHYNPCSLDATAMADLFLTECDEFGDSITAAQSCASTLLVCRPCGDVIGDGTRANSGTSGPMLPDSPFITTVETQVTQERCPSYSTALGAALGYATYIELVLTILVVAGFKACKVIQVVSPSESGGVGSLVASGLGVSQKEFEQMRNDMAHLQKQLASSQQV